MTVPEAMAMVRDAKTEQAHVEAVTAAVRALGEKVRHNLNDDEYAWARALIAARDEGPETFGPGDFPMSWDEYRRICLDIWMGVNGRSWEEYEVASRKIWEAPMVSEGEFGPHERALLPGAHR